MTEFVRRERERPKHYGRLYTPQPGVPFAYLRHNKLRKFVMCPQTGTIMTQAKYAERQARRRR